MKGNKRFTFLIALLVLSIVLIGGTTYALFTKSVATSKILSMQSGTRYIGIYGSNKENINLNVTYNFSIENRGLESASYNLYLEDITNTIGKSNIIYTYSKNGVNKTGTLEDGILDTANLKSGESVMISIHLSSVISGNYQGKIKVDTHSATEDNSGASKPELVGDMIPVIYDNESSSWIKADIHSMWYNYETQEWANAVTIKDASNRARYISSEVGTKIDMKDINTMWVWIPRYSYTLGNTYGTKLDGALEPSVEAPGSFDIKFVDKSVIDNGNGVYTGEVADNYYTPSAFCFGNTCDTSRGDTGNIELSGVWVSKFELSGTSDDLTSIPNSNSLRNQTLASFFTAITTNFQGENGKDRYGLSGNYDVHMIKNTEWGVQAYLSQSKYGKYGNQAFLEANKEIYINNYYDDVSKTTLTGCSSGTVSSPSSKTCSYPYNSPVSGVGASTTGYIYGIYDTVGGAYEIVMGNYNQILSESGAGAMPEARYYNLYTGITGIRGDATNTDGTFGFYGDSGVFVNDTSPWFVRGSFYNSGQDASSGVFSYVGHTGRADENVGTRMSLVTW